MFLFYGTAGQGKSVLAADFLSSIKAPFLWYRLDREDRDPSTFLDHLAEGISSDGADLNTNKEESLETKLHNFIAFVADSREGEHFIVLDDFQNVNEEATCCDIVTFLIDHLPPQMHIIIISSSYPRLDITRFRSENELVELFDRDLSFSIEEVKKLSREIYELSLDDATLEAIYDITRGWITGITYLFEHTSKLSRDEQHDFFERFFQHNYLQSIDDFLREEVIEVLNPEIAALLMQTSLFEEVTPELLSLFRESDGEELFRELRAGNTFLETETDESLNFTYSPLFSAFLQRMFTELPESVRNNAHFIAGNYYLKNNESGNAIRHYFKAGFRDQAKELFIESADNMLANGEYEATQRLLELFTKQEIVQSPLLSYYDGLVMNLIAPFSSRKNLLGLLPYFRETGENLREARVYSELLSNYLFYLENEESVKELTDMARDFLEFAGDKLPTDRREILNALVALGSWWIGQTGNKPYEAALRAEETSYKFQNDEALLCSRLVLSKMYIYKGEFADSLKLLQKTERIFDKYPAKHPYHALIRFSLGDSYFYLGQIERAINETETALSSLQEGFAVTRFLKLNLALYYLYTDDYEKAEAVFETERVKEVGENLYLQYFWIYLLQMLIAYRNDNARRAEYYCKRLMEKANSHILMQDYPYSYLAVSEINIYVENFETAEQYINKVLERDMKQDNPYVYATAVALLGYLKHLQKDAASSKKHFAETDNILREKGYKNLDICDPALLQKIASVSGSGIFPSFPRLESRDTDRQMVQPAETYDLEFKTLGTFRIFMKGQEIEQSDLARQKRVTDLLMLLLVFRENGINKEVVYETFWPRYSYKSARDNLNTIVYRLRKIINGGIDFISTDMNIIKLKEGTFALDVDLFRKYIDLGKAAERKNDPASAVGYYKNAQELYKGDFLSTGPYLDFIRDERENLRNAYKQLLFSLAKLSLDTEQYREALTWANTLITFDPLCEPAYRLLMIASCLTDNRNEITRIFEKLKAVLMENYTIEPGEKTVKLKKELLADGSPVSSLWREETII